MDPWQALALVVGAIVTLAGVFYRHLLKQISKLEAEVTFWRDRALRMQALAEMATDHADKADSR